MDSESKLLDKTVELSEGKDLINNSVEDTIGNNAFQLLINSQIYKQPRMEQIRRYEKLYNNDIPPKLRQLFNVPLPVFSGMIDTLLSDFNDPIDLKFGTKNPAQYLLLPKLQAQFDDEKDGLAPNQRWNQKARWDRFNAALSGRGILKFFSESDPSYRSVLETVNYSDFHCQPLGGGNLENHLFAGQEGIMKTVEEIYTDEAYNKTQREKLKNFAFSSEWWQQIEDTYGTKLQRFRSLALDPVTNSFGGDRVLNLCEFVITFRGRRYYVVFEPLTQTWLRVEPWADLCPSERFPWKSWATHEDHKNFWSKSFADDLYHAADAIITLFNQELTNREKRNFNPRAYDEAMFTDVAKLDKASYRPDALVPVTVEAGKSIEHGIYTFQTAELQGTISLVGFIEQNVGQSVGVSDLSQGNVKSSGKRASVVIAQQQQTAKRIGFRSDSFNECYAELGLAYIEGLKENMPSSVKVKIIGEGGFVEEQELRRLELRRSGDWNIAVMSRSKQEQIDNIKRESRANAMKMLANSQNINAKWRDEQILRSVGQYPDEEIASAFDTQTYGSRKSIAHASQAIQDILSGKKPKVWYGADAAFMQYVYDYAVDNRDKLEDKATDLLRFFTEMVPIVKTNMKRKAIALKAGSISPSEASGDESGSSKPLAPPGAPGAPGGPAAPPGGAPPPPAPAGAAQMANRMAGAAQA